MEDWKKQRMGKTADENICVSKTAVENWTDFEMNEALAESLVANKFEKPTEV